MVEMSNMKIGIDGLNLALSRGTGVATYARVLAASLQGMGAHVEALYGLPLPHHMPFHKREECFFDSLAHNDAVPPRPRCPHPAWWNETLHHFIGHKAVSIPVTDKERAQNYQKNIPPGVDVFNVPSLFRAAQGFFRKTGRFVPVKMPSPPNIMHWTYPVPVYVVGARNVYTLHDLVPIMMPETTLDDLPLYSKMIRKIVQNSAAICTVSETSKRDIIRFSPESDGKVFNTYQAHVPHQVNGNEGAKDDLVTKKFRLDTDRYYLFFGQLEPKKNIGRLLEAFLASPTKRILVLVGSHGWKQEEELRLLPKALESGRVVHIPYLPEEELLALIRQARAVLFPSIAEGFGLPVLEAFSQGTAVLTSRSGSLREVSGDAALLVEPYDISSIRDGITALDQDDALCFRLQKMGVERCEYFNIEHYQKRLYRFYDDVLS